MPKKYIHKKRGKTLAYEQTSLESAVKAVQSGGFSVRQAAATFSVPRSTIADRISGRYELQVRHGRPPALPDSVEKTIVSSIKMASKLGMGLSRKQIIRRTHTLCQRTSIDTTYRNFKAGKDWFEGLRRRHPELVLRKPEKLSSTRARMMNPEVVQSYFKDLSTILGETPLEAAHIWNCDETGFNFEHCPVNVVAEKGDRCVMSRTSCKSSNVTVMGCISASGNHMPPMIITKGKTQRALQGFNVSEAPDKCVWTFQKNGWIDDEIGEKWFDQVFLKFCGPFRPQLLILDGHGSHETMAIIERAIAENIILISLPPHCTHALQPLDRTVFGPLKAAYNEQCSDFLVEHPLHVVNKWTFPTLFRKAWEQAVTAENIKQGFRTCGIAPFNPAAVPASAYGPSKATNVVQPTTAAETQQTIFVDSTPQPDAVQSGPSAENIVMQIGAEETGLQPVVDLSDPQQLFELINSGDFLVQDITSELPSDVFDSASVGLSEPLQLSVTAEPTTVDKIITSLFLPPALEKRAPTKRKMNTSHKILTTQQILEEKRQKEQVKLQKEMKKKIKTEKK